MTSARHLLAHLLLPVLILLPPYTHQWTESEEYCRSYGTRGDDLLRNRGLINFPDGVQLEQIVDGPLRLVRLQFNRTVDLRRVTLQLRVNPTVRVYTNNNGKQLKVSRNVTDFFHLQADQDVPMQTDLHQELPIKSIMLQGFDAQLTHDEILLINFTVCAHDCQGVPGCYGDCRVLAKDFGCLECQCPKGSLSSGCSGIPTKDLEKLFDATKGQLQFGCQFKVGYRRQTNRAVGIDDCVPFTYPKCPFYNKVSIPNTKIQCLNHCY